jgi:hypothetical protein
MGTDIHCFVEKEVSEGVWEKQYGFESDWYKPNDEYFGGDCYKSTDQPIESRNYTLFTLLCGVRDRDQGITPISEPRGLPDDISSETKTYFDDDWELHSVSNVTLKELLSALDDDQEVTREVIVSMSEYKQYIKTGIVESYCRGVGGGNTKLVSLDEMNDLIKSKVSGEFSYYTIVKFTEKINDCMGILINHTIPQLKERSEKDDFSDIRLVFGFDC